MSSSLLYKGSIAVAWGNSTGAQTYAYSASATALAVTALTNDTTKEAKIEEMPDPLTGAPVALVIYDRRTTFRLTCYPSASSISGANAAAVTLPNVGDAFVITDSNDTALAAGKYVVQKVSRMRKYNARVEFDVEVTAYENDLTATISS